MNNQSVKRCKRCYLPSNYAGISFDEEGVCNYCQKERDEHQYAGIDALRNDINKILSESRNRPYDCAVAFSGGRDSSYLLYFAKEVLGLKVLAVTLKHDFVTPEAEENINHFVKKIDVDLHIINNSILNEISRSNLRCWSKKPDAAMCMTFCTGCRYGILNMIPDFVKKQGIPLLLDGDTPYEQADYRTNLFCDSKTPTTASRLFGYAKRLLKNPLYIFNTKGFYYQIIEFFSWRNKQNNRSKIHIIKPFYYIEYDEEVVVSKIKELGWKYNQSFASTWRADCYVNVLRQFFYKRFLGYNDLDFYYSKLLRRNKIQLSEVADLIRLQGDYDETLVRTVLKRFYGIDYDEIMNKIS